MCTCLLVGNLETVLCRGWTEEGASCQTGCKEGREIHSFGKKYRFIILYSKLNKSIYVCSSNNISCIISTIPWLVLVYFCVVDDKPRIICKNIGVDNPSIRVYSSLSIDIFQYKIYFFLSQIILEVHAFIIKATNNYILYK